VSDGVFETVGRVVRAKIVNPKNALLQDITRQIRTTSGLRQAEKGVHDRVDIEVGHLQSAVVKIDQALHKLNRIRNLSIDQQNMVWSDGLTRIKDEIAGNVEVMTKGGGAPRKLSPMHIALSVMGALKRGKVPTRNWRALTSELLEQAAGLPRNEATTGARYAREWMSAHSPK
jgi:hypothetical protein